jgi:hypothetical protein
MGTWTEYLMVLEAFQQRGQRRVNLRQTGDLPVALSLAINYSVHILPVVAESCCGICFTHKGS